MFWSLNLFAQTSKELNELGWKELIKDNDTIALRYFSKAHQTAINEDNHEESGNALLNMGICSFSVSFSQGLDYCFQAMEEFKKLDPAKSLHGRSKCLQLISTIKSRQGKFLEAIPLSREAMLGFPSEKDTSGYLGLIYSSLGGCYAKLNQPDSSEFYLNKALQEHLLANNTTYLPGAYQAMSDVLVKKGNKEISKNYLDKALSIAILTENRQAQVLVYIGLSKWANKFEKDLILVENYLIKAKSISSNLTDRSFYLKTLEQLISLEKQRNDFEKALQYDEEYSFIKDTLSSWEKQRMIKTLEVQFDVAEKDRLLKLAQKEKAITSLTNYILWGTIGFILLIAVGIFSFLKRINKRDKILLQTKDELMKLTEEQKRLKEQQLQNEIEFKESQLSALALQMLQKNELLQELKEKIDDDRFNSKDTGIGKIISKGQTQEKEWSDFNRYFESINKNFYTRLKQAYPDISPNDLKICALIKLNMSIKEMAGILNISPDSVKTARYRLRKKLQMNTEDNLTDFILNL